MTYPRQKRRPPPTTDEEEEDEDDEEEEEEEEEGDDGDYYDHGRASSNARKKSRTHAAQKPEAASVSIAGQSVCGCVYVPVCVRVRVCVRAFPTSLMTYGSNAAGRRMGLFRVPPPQRPRHHHLLQHR